MDRLKLIFRMSNPSRAIVIPCLYDQTHDHDTQTYGTGLFFQIYDSLLCHWFHLWL